MSLPGPVEFPVSPLFGTHPVFDGMEINITPSSLEKVPSRGANVLTFANGTATLQLDYQDDTETEAPGLFYEFRMDLFAHEENPWWHIAKLEKSRARFYFIPWDFEVEVFAVGRSLSSWVLPRPTAASQSEHPDVASYQTRAWLDDVEQTVIASGTPGSGEVKVVGRDVTTPTLTAGQELVVRYAPAYYVAIVGLGSQRLNGHNDLVKPLVLTELRPAA